jgi:integrating conjugative element protein (TIGR03759 family)
MNYKLIFLILLIIANGAVASDDVINTKTQNTISQNTTINTSHIGTAKDWALTENEWKQYLNLMQGSSGHYYAHLSPPAVLGIQANNIEDVRHFAELTAKFEHDKLERELKFNAAFHTAAAKLYSTEPIIQPFDYAPFTPVPRN